MNGLRWGVVVCVIGGVALMSGCGGKWMSRADIDKINQERQLNDQQASLVTALTYEKERLTNENAALRAQMGDKTVIISAQDQLIRDLQSKGIGVKEPGASPTDIPDVGVHSAADGVHLVVSSDLLFDAGSATLKTKGVQTITKVADSIKDKKNRIVVEGFTDSAPIKHSHWKSNFDLSGARALAVLEALEKDGVAPERLHFAGFGEFSLVKDTNGKENPKLSRRAEIVLLNEGADLPAAATPAPAKAPAAPKKEPAKAVVPK